MINIRRLQRGDTIVEVMIVLAILGLAISITYATANQSLLAARQAQESSQASSLLQSQVELMQGLRKNPSTPANEYIYQAGPYCIDPSTKKIVTVNIASDCVFDVNAQNLDGSGNGRYTLRISQELPSAPPSPNASRFRITVTWDDVRGEGTDKATFNYRIYPT